MTEPTLRLGVSACLLGERVRYDGGHKRDAFVAEALTRFFELVPACPEVGAGLGVPRPPIHLVGDPHAPRAISMPMGGRDLTGRLTAFALQTARALEDVSGFILKSRSPSCGLRDATIHPGRGAPQCHGSGIFAQALMDALPLHPVEDELRLAGPAERENFLERVYAYGRWQAMVARGITPPALTAFHAVHKLVLMAHSPERYRALGRLVATAGGGPIAPLAQTYIALFMDTLRMETTRGRHANVLQHLAGYLKKALSREEKDALTLTITNYRAGREPFSVPLSLLQRHFRRHPHPYVADQVYLYPPAALMTLLPDR